MATNVSMVTNCNMYGWYEQVLEILHERSQPFTDFRSLKVMNYAKFNHKCYWKEMLSPEIGTHDPIILTIHLLH